MIASQNILKMKLKFPKVDFVNVFENDCVCFVNECKWWIGQVQSKSLRMQTIKVDVLNQSGPVKLFSLPQKSIYKDW